MQSDTYPTRKSPRDRIRLELLRFYMFTRSVLLTALKAATSPLLAPSCYNAAGRHCYGTLHLYMPSARSASGRLGSSPCTPLLASGSGNRGHDINSWKNLTPMVRFAEPYRTRARDCMKGQGRCSPDRLYTMMQGGTQV